MSADTEPALAEARERIVDQEQPAHVPADLWALGRRRYRSWVIAAAAVVVLIALASVLPLVAGGRSQPASPALDPPSVPSTVYAALPLQSTVQAAPPGPATVLLTGAGGFGASDITGYEDRALVVGASGQYRWLRHVNGFDAGESVLLSPDGRYVAGDGGVEGGAVGDGLMQDFTVVVDLTTGHARTFHAGYPLAWTPDGRTLLINQVNTLRLLSLDSGIVVDTGIGLGLGTGTAFAFSPDGADVVMQVSGEVRIVDLAARTQHTLVRLGGHRLLAGPGAWRADGSIAVWDTSGCGCAYPAILHLEMSYVDSKFGTDVYGPRLDEFDALGARLLGWRDNGDAVVDRDQPGGHFAPGGAATYPLDGHAELVALSPGGGAQRLLSLPGGTNRVEVAARLLDRLGGASPSIGYRLADWLRTHLDDLVGLVASTAVIIAIVLLRRRFKRRRVA